MSVVLTTKTDLSTEESMTVPPERCTLPPSHLPTVSNTLKNRMMIIWYQEVRLVELEIPLRKSKLES